MRIHIKLHQECSRGTNDQNVRWYKLNIKEEDVQSKALGSNQHIYFSETLKPGPSSETSNGLYYLNGYLDWLWHWGTGVSSSMICNFQGKYMNSNGNPVWLSCFFLYDVIVCFQGRFFLCVWVSEKYFSDYDTGVQGFLRNIDYETLKEDARKLIFLRCCHVQIDGNSLRYNSLVPNVIIDRFHLTNHNNMKHPSDTISRLFSRHFLNHICRSFFLPF